jgi:hypothetical protein
MEKEIIQQNSSILWTPLNSLPDYSQCKTREDWKNYLNSIGWPDHPQFPFEVNRWGSCQYSTALAIYDLYCQMKLSLFEDEILEVLGVEITHHGLESFENAKSKFIEHAIDRYRNWENGHHEIDARRVQNFDEIFYVLRNWDTDLWFAAPFVCKLAFKNFDIKCPSSPGLGPYCNIEAQSANFVAGICCAYLAYDIVSNETAFHGFDT